MKTIVCWAYDADTKEFRYKAIAKTINGKKLLPKNTTLTECTLIQKDGFARIFSNKTWVYVEDHRSETTYNKKTKEKIIIKKLGNIPETLTKIKPTTEYHKWNGTKWIVDTTKENKLKIINKIIPNIDKETAIELSSGLTFEGNIFPLIGDAYAYNMTGATAYVIGQSTGGRELLDITGNYVKVKSISGLVSLGDSTVTSIVKSAVDEKIALQSKTTTELLSILNSY